MWTLQHKTKHRKNKNENYNPPPIMTEVRLNSKYLFKGNSHVRDLGLSWDQTLGPQQKVLL